MNRVMIFVMWRIPWRRYYDALTWPGWRVRRWDRKLAPDIAAIRREEARAVADGCRDRPMPVPYIARAHRAHRKP